MRSARCDLPPRARSGWIASISTNTTRACERSSDTCHRTISSAGTHRPRRPVVRGEQIAPSRRNAPRGNLRLVDHTIAQIGLAERANTPVGKLSGGQRKRVSVGAELLCRPRLMFLDEPTSGLDPAAETRLMQSLRELSTNGCTIVCTTHVMGNAYLFDKLAVVNAGRLVFFGEPAAALRHFGVEHLENLYERLETLDPAGIPPSCRRARSPASKPMLATRAKRPAALPILLMRQWAILRSDWKKPPARARPAGLHRVSGDLGIEGIAARPLLRLYRNAVVRVRYAAQEIVKELPMFRRERLIGLGRHDTCWQRSSPSPGSPSSKPAALGVMQIMAGGLKGSMGWQIAGLILTATASVGVGLAISALSRVCFKQ